MLSLPIPMSLMLCALAPSVTAAYHHHSHYKPSEYQSSLPFSSGSPFASGSNSPPIPSGAASRAPYPAGNGTIYGLTATGTGTISTTFTTTIKSTIYMTAPGEGESPASTGDVGILGPDSGPSSCLAPTTVTVSQISTITVTASSSQSLVETPVPLESQLPGQASISTPGASVVPVSSSVDAEDQAPSGTSTVEQVDKLVRSHASTQSAILDTISSKSASTSATSTKVNIPSSSSTVSNANSASSSSTAQSSTSLTPNGIKAGVAGYQSITDKSAWSQFTPHIGWYSDYWPNTPDSGSVSGIGMVRSIYPKISK